jgi:hypothetical protein
VQGFNSQRFQTVLSRDYGPMLFLQEPSHPYFLALVECTKVRLRLPFGKLLQGEFHLLQADWGLAVSTAQVRRIIALIICIEYVITNPWYRGQVQNPCNICSARFCSWLQSFCWKHHGGSSSCARDVVHMVLRQKRSAN